MDSIHLEGMRFYAYHGHYAEEHEVGTHFEVDVILYGDLTPAAQSDQLDDAIDYQKAYAIIRQEMSKISNLLEHVAKRIASALHNEFNALEQVTVNISKFNPPLGGEIRRVRISLTQ